jgi:hypothetical protein
VAAEEDWTVKVNGAVAYLSPTLTGPTVADLGDPIGTKYLHAAADFSNEHQLDARVSAVMRVSKSDGTFIGGCTIDNVGVVAELTSRFSCVVADSVTGKAFGWPLGSLSGLKTSIDLRVLRWDDVANLPLEDVGLNITASGLDLVEHAASDPHCRWYRPWAAVNSQRSDDFGALTQFRFFDGDGVLIGTSGEVLPYTFRAGEAVHASARMNPCFDVSLPQPERVELVTNHY